MPLTSAHKKYLKKHIRKTSLTQIAVNLGIPEKEIKDYLKSQWRKEKYQKFLEKEETVKSDQVNGVSIIKTREKEELSGFRGWFNKNWKIFLFLTFLVSVSYFNSLKNAFISDDITAIRDNPLIGQISYFWQPPYSNFFALRPLIIFLIHHFFGPNPLFYRLSNILPHLGSTILIYFLIKRFFARPIPLITASVFATHPILTEAVTWISGGPYSEGTFFVLFSFLLYLETQNDVFPHRVSEVKLLSLPLYFLSILLFLLAIFFTEKFLIFPLILTVYEFYRGHLKTAWKRLLPFWAVSGVLLINLASLLANRTSVIAKVSYVEPGINNPFIQIPIAITTYLKLIFWPKDLAFYHAEGIYNQSQYLFSLLVFLLFLGLAVYSFKRNRIFFFWLSFFLIALLPTLTPFRVSDVIAERYVYFGSLGIFVFIAWLVQKVGELAKNQKVSYLLLIIIIASLSTRTILRNRDFRNPDTLWLATAKTSPAIPQNHNNLGEFHARQNNWEKAIEEFKMAVELEPKFAIAYQNLATAYYQLEKYDLAVENYQKAIALDSTLWQSYHNLATIYASTGKLDLAIEHVEKAVSIDPKSANSYALSGIIYLQMGNKQRAKEQLEKALELDPQDEEAKKLLLESEK